MSKCFKSSKLFGQDGEEFPAEELNGKLVGLYFSAHWCPPCRNFTPRLAAKYEELKAAGHPFEIVFISSDSSAAACTEYFAEMPWKCLDYGDRRTKEMLSSPMLFNVTGIPTLVLLDGDGKLITKDGRDAVMNTPFEDLPNYEVKKKEEAARLEAALETLPASIVHPSHPHELVKTPNVYGGRGYGCNVCGGGGKGWAYQCARCGFDAHPKCVCEI